MGEFKLEIFLGNEHVTSRTAVDGVKNSIISAIEQVQDFKDLNYITYTTLPAAYFFLNSTYLISREPQYTVTRGPKVAITTYNVVLYRDNETQANSDGVLQFICRKHSLFCYKLKYTLCDYFIVQSWQT